MLLLPYHNSLFFAAAAIYHIRLFFARCTWHPVQKHNLPTAPCAMPSPIPSIDPGGKHRYAFVRQTDNRSPPLQNPNLPTNRCRTSTNISTIHQSLGVATLFRGVFRTINKVTPNKVACIPARAHAHTHSAVSFLHEPNRLSRPENKPRNSKRSKNL